MQMNWPIKPQKINLDLVLGWLRTETDKLNNVLNAIENEQSYNDDYIYDSIKSAEVALRQMRKFIDDN